METDAELLQRFAADSDETAFRGLVDRHAGMVYGVALRVTGDTAMAEEAAQGVFTTLARKARGLGHKKLSGWLHDTAVFEARNHARKAARYRKAVSAYRNEMTPPPPDENPWERISPHLDEVLGRLPERSKNMVLMRFYQRLSFKEIAAAFGKSEEASRKEVDRSVQHLGTLLKKRGVATTGAALSAILAGQTLCVSPASAATLATVSLGALPQAAYPFLERAADWMGIGERKTILAVLLALTPAAFLWAQNLRLRERIETLSQAHPSAAPVPAVVVRNDAPRPVSPAPEAAPAPAVAALPQHTPEKILAQAREQASTELTRISLNLPSLTDDQKARIQAVFEKRNAEKLTAKTQAFESGAVRRYAVNPDQLSAEDKALLFAMEGRRIPPAEDGEVEAVLSAEQFTAYVLSEEAKRVSNAETTAGDVLKGVGQSIDLNAAQKDRIFQELARLEMEGASLTEEQRARPFGERDATEEARDQIVLAELSPEQAEVYTKYRAGRKAGFLEFLKNFGPKEGSK